MAIYILSFLLLLSIFINAICIRAIMDTDNYYDIDSASYCGDTMTLHTNNKDIKISYTKINNIINEIHKKISTRNIN